MYNPLPLTSPPIHHTYRHTINHLTTPDRSHLLHKTTRRNPRSNRLHPAVPLLPIDSIGEHKKLPARYGRASGCTLGLRQYNAALPTTGGAGSGDPNAGGNLGAGARHAGRTQLDSVSTYPGEYRGFAELLDGWVAQVDGASGCFSLV